MIQKILNDPVYGFINIPSGILTYIIEHPYFQRLRRIRQLGFTEYVYPGAIHTRFQHTLGALHLMDSAISILRTKGHVISSDEEQAAKLAILLHDVGHAPFSHTLESVLWPQYTHEDFSLMIMNQLNAELKGELELTIDIFQNKYHKKFLHQLVSSQLDVDRLDYLKRDSFYTGVSEGVIGSDRIIKMLNLVDDELVVEAKGIYSIEKFLIARWLMYWQVYLHKTTVCADRMLVKVIERVKEIGDPGNSKANLLGQILSGEKYESDKELIERFAQLDDSDIIVGLKEWAKINDKVTGFLAKNLLSRKLFKIEVQNHPFSESRIEQEREKARHRFTLDKHAEEYFVFSGSFSNNAYSPGDDKIRILYKDGSLKDIAEASDMLDISIISKIVKKYFLCYPKDDSDYNY